MIKQTFALPSSDGGIVFKMGGLQKSSNQLFFSPAVHNVYLGSQQDFAQGDLNPNLKFFCSRNVSIFGVEEIGAT